MKIGIITILKVNNYGAELQAYATQAFLKALGHDAEIIDYLFYKHPHHKRTALSSPLFRFNAKKRVAENLYPLIGKIKSLTNRAKAKERERKFESFHEAHTSLSRTYRSLDELYGADFDYDIFLTGSDQVWNPGIYSSIAPYFLDFAPDGKRRIAYASSFGVSAIPQNCIDRYKTYLQKYSAIGVREKDAVEIVNSISGQQAQWVLDPTLLLTADDWRKVAGATDLPSDDFVLVYELTPCSYIMELSRFIARKRNLKIVRICKDASPVEKDTSILNITDAGPAEFLFLFDKASFVVTNSFHGTAFSINFNKPFFTVLPNRKQNNSRQRSLLNLLGISDRCLIEGCEFPAETSFELDFSPVNRALNAERKNSRNFIARSING